MTRNTKYRTITLFCLFTVALFVAALSPWPMDSLLSASDLGLGRLADVGRHAGA